MLTFYFRPIFLFSKDALNELKVTIKTFMRGKKICQINVVRILFIYLFLIYFLSMKGALNENILSKTFEHFPTPNIYDNSVYLAFM